MIVLSNLTAETIAPGQAVTFNNVILKSGNCECHNMQVPRVVKLRAQGIYALSFSGNVTSPTAGDNVQLAIAVANEPLIETAMNRTITTANNLENIATQTRYKNCCCDLDHISVINTGTVPVTLAPNSAFIIERRA